MADAIQQNSDGADRNGPKYYVNIDGKDYSWTNATITAVDIRSMAGWSSDQSVDEVDLKTGSKTSISDSQVIDLKPGHGFAKKIEFVSGTVTPPRSHGC